MSKLKSDRKALGKGGAICEKKVYSLHPSRRILQKVPCFESRVLDTKECGAMFPACNRHVVFLTFYNAIPAIILFVYHLRVFSVPLECIARVVSLAATDCLSHVIDTLPLFPSHRRFRAASTHQWPCVRGCASADSAVNSVKRRRALQETSNKSGSEGRCPARLACTTLEHSGGKHLGCGRFLADQTLCQVKEKKRQKKKRTGTGKQNLADSPRTLRAFI